VSSREKPEPYEEVQIQVGESRSCWHRSYVLIAYLNKKGEWRQFWNPSVEPLVGVLSWRPKPNVNTKSCSGFPTNLNQV